MPKPERKRKRYDTSSSIPMQIASKSRRSYLLTKAPESKWFEATVSGTTMASAGTVLSSSINLIDEGNGVNQMAGRKVVVTKLQMRLTVQSTPNTNAAVNNLFSSPQYRLAIILDRQCNGTTASVLDVFQTNNLRTFNNLSNSRRFKILKEIEGVVETPITYDATNSVFAASRNTVQHTVYLRVNIPITFVDQSGGARVLSEITSNNILVIGYSVNGNAEVSYRTRIRFTDS